MMNQGQKVVYTATRNQPLVGRNANIQPTMFKRKQIFEKASTERSQTPFSGYSFTKSSVTDNNSLARSQVSEFNQQLVVRMIKQEMQKNGFNALSETSEQSLKNKNELNILRIQIRSIKQSYHELNKSFKRKFQQQNDTISELKKQFNSRNKDQSLEREQISAQLVDKIKEVEQDIAVKMRVIFSKMQEDLRKQLTNYANRQFVPTSFLDDLDKQLNELDDRIANIEVEFEANKNQGNKQNAMTASKIQRDSSVILTNNSQLKLNKLERDFQFVKKILDQKSFKIKQLDQLIEMGRQNHSRQLKQVKDSLNDASLGIRQLKKQSQNSKQSMQKKIQLFKKNLTETIECQIQNLNKKIYQQSLLKSQNLQNSNSNSQIQQLSFVKKTEGRTIFIQNSDILSQSVKTQQSRQISQSNESQSILKQQKQSPKKSKKITITYGANEKVLSPLNNLQTSLSQQINKVQNQQINQSLNNFNSPSKPSSNSEYSEKLSKQNKGQQKDENFIKTIYKVDKQGYLMDNENKYILSPSNSMIFVNQTQIQQIQKSNLIKVQKWSDQNN